MPSLSAPQNIFLNGLNTKYRAYVGGYGCLHPDTKIFTEHGLIRISDIHRPMRVLSWNQRNQKFQLSLSGGSFPKGRANLYRVSTTHGEFVSSAHHRIFSSDHKYLRIDQLRVGDCLSSCAEDLLCSMKGSDLLSLPLDVQHYTKINEDCLGGYASEARLYGQQFLGQSENDKVPVPLLGDVQALPLFYGSFSFSRLGAQLALKLKHNRLYRFAYRLYRKHSTIHKLNLFAFLGDQIAALFVGHTSCYHQKERLSVETLEHHYNVEQYSLDEHSSLSPIEVIGVKVEEESPYYDMQVLDTNNYVCENGFIHHNSGKTFVGCLDLLNFFSLHPGTVQGYFAPSYSAIRDIFYPTFEEACHLLGFTVDIKVSNKECHVYRNGRYYGTVICRSMDNPGSIIGFKIARALVDEIDVLPKDKANLAWIKIIARMRLKIDGVENGIGVTTTPEGFLFVYETFKKDPKASYSMVQASSYENEKYLPDDYIDSLLETYPVELVAAYVMGLFVNLKTGTVYNNFDRKKNNSDEIWNGEEPVFIGMDFNVGKMAAIIHVKRKGNPIAVDEIINAYDTPEMITIIQQRYQKATIRIYPDASGDSRKSVNASKTDISLLEQAGFSVIANKKNPFVKDRVLAMNQLFCDNKDIRKYLVNVDRCPTYADNLEQQAWNDAGEPDKKHDNDHTNDAGGYFIAYDYPIIKPVTKLITRFAR